MLRLSDIWYEKQLCDQNFPGALCPPVRHFPSACTSLDALGQYSPTFSLWTLYILEVIRTLKSVFELQLYLLISTLFIVKI